MFKKNPRLILQFSTLSLCIGIILSPSTVQARKGRTHSGRHAERYESLDEGGIKSRRTTSFWRTELWYAQTPGFWGALTELRKKTHTLAEIDSLLQDNFNHPDEGMAHFAFRYYGDARKGLGKLASHGYAGVRGDLLVGGVAKNRIFPSVQGYKTYTAQFEFGLENNPEHNDPDSTWNYQWGNVIGIGSQEVVDGLAIDLYPKPPVDKASLFYWGLDLHLGYEGIFNESLRAENQIFFLPTLFHADATDSNYNYQVRRNDVTWRWRTETEWWMALIGNPEESAALELAFFGIGGQQPVPVMFLPRVWDAIHQIDPLPAPGQLLGLGSGLSLHSSDNRYAATAKAGFFGGYLGAIFQLRLKWFEAGVGTVGLEQTSSYRVTESRIKYGQVGVRYEF